MKKKTSLCVVAVIAILAPKGAFIAARMTHDDFSPEFLAELAERARFYAKDDNLRRAGAAAGHMWRFIREMKVGDLLVTPHRAGFYVGRIAGAACCDRSAVEVERHRPSGS